MYSDLTILAEKEGGELGCEPVPEARGLEVLSPLLPLGGRMSLVVVVRARAGAGFVVDMGMNPGDRVQPRLYRYFPGLRFTSSFSTQPLEEVRLPFRGRVAEGQRCAVFLLELTTKEEAPAERVKVEPAAWIPKPGEPEFWNRYPLEVRLADMGPRPDANLEDCDAPLRSVALAALQACRLECRQTDELTLGTFLTRQFRSDFAIPPSAPICSGPWDEADLLGRFAAARASNARSGARLLN